MNKCESCVRAIKRMCIRTVLLPSAYQQVEYLLSEADGQYIDTGVAATAVGGFDTKFRLDYTSTGYRAGFGCNSSSKGNIWVGTSNANNVSININQSSYTTTTGVDHTISYIGRVLKIDAATQGTCNYSPGDSTTFKLFTFGTGALNQQTYTKIYYFRLYDSNGIVRDMYPCYRKSDNKTGVYDRITKTFYPNLGSGEFVVGPPVVLPKDYQCIRYLEGTGTQYIDTGIVPLLTDSVYADYQFTNVSVMDNTLFYIDKGAANNNAYGLSTSRNSGAVGYVCGWGNYTISNSPELNTNRHTVNLCNGVFKYDGATWVTKSGSPSIDKNIFLFGWHRGDSVAVCGKVKVFRFTVSPSENSTNPYMDLIPCYRKSDNKPGMYDLVTDTFFTNAGSGEFTLGSDL